MQAVTIVQITPDELSTLIIDCVNSCLKYHKSIEIKKQDEDQWMDLNQLCNYMPDQPSKPTVYGWVHLNKIPFHKGGKKLRFLKSEIDNWMRS